MNDDAMNDDAMNDDAMNYHPTNPDNDPYGPPAISTLVHCIHCGEEYDSYRIEWREEQGADGRLHGLWCCPIQGCTGAGFGIDIFPVDPEYRDEDGELMWDDDEDDEFVDEFDDDLDAELDEEFDELADDQDDWLPDVPDEEIPFGRFRRDRDDDLPF